MKIIKPEPTLSSAIRTFFTQLITLTVLFFTVTFATTAMAIPVTYTQNIFSSTGTLGDINFSGQRIRFSFTGDTDNIFAYNVDGPTRNSAGFVNQLGTTTITLYDTDFVTEMATASFLDDIFVSVDNTFGGIGFGSYFNNAYEPLYPYALFASGSNPDLLATYDLASDLAFSASALSCVGFEYGECLNRDAAAANYALTTSLGDFYLQWSGIRPATFSTEVSPIDVSESAPLSLLSLGLGVLLISRRKLKVT